MRLLFLLASFAASLAGQVVPGTVTVNSYYTITAATSTIKCVLHRKSAEVANINCTVAGVSMMSATMTLAPSTSSTPGNGAVGSYVNAGNNITWIVSQPMGQTLLSWQMAANGTQKSGTF